MSHGIGVIIMNDINSVPDISTNIQTYKHKYFIIKVVIYNGS